jgi:hypothetical protein
LIEQREVQKKKKKKERKKLTARPTCFQALMASLEVLTIGKCLAKIATNSKANNATLIFFPNLKKKNSKIQVPLWTTRSSPKQALLGRASTVRSATLESGG